MQVTVDTRAKTVTIDGREAGLRDIEIAAHQDDPIWLYYEGVAAPPQDQETRDLAAKYRSILAEVRRAIEAAEAEERRNRIRACPGHAATREDGPWGFVAPVNPDEQNRAAHGNVGFTELCRCGAKRRYLVNGLHVEMGIWC